MLSKKNKENFGESSYIQFDTINNEINSNNKKLNKFWKRKIVFYIILLILIIFFIIIIYQNYKFSTLSNEIKLIKNNITKEKENKNNIEHLYKEGINENKQLLKDLEELKGEIKSLKGEFDLLSQIFYPYKSDIITSMNELNYIREIVKGNKIELIYKSSINGDNKKTFYNITKNDFSYLVLILSQKGKKFGGYTSLNFEGKKIPSSYIEQLKYDNKAFLFSLDAKKTFKLIKDKYALICDNDSIINFGENDLVISNNFLSEDSYSNFPFNFEGQKNEKNLFVDENSNFKVKEIEIFHISKLI
jgi:cell division protein FtsL